jgi:GH43 family beta-xylosidase
MTLIVEDGSIVTGAESYATVAEATAYHAARNNTAWAALATDALREAALRKATEYMVSTYRARWQGTRKTEDQALCWPRYDVVIEGYLVDDASVPETIKRACAELALRASAADLNPDLTQGVAREKVGQIEVEYDKASPQFTRYRAIDALLSPYLKAGGGGCSMGLIRS